MGVNKLYNLYRAYKTGKTIKSVKPGTDLGGKTVSQAKMDASIAKIKADSFEIKQRVTDAMKKMKDIKSK